MTASRRATALAFGFSTAVAMWTLGFLTRVPPVVLPSPLVLVVLLVALVVGGAFAGRGQGGASAGAATGAVASLVNLLVLGSLLSGDGPNRLAPGAMLWIPGSLALGAALGAIGGRIGQRLPELPAPLDPTSILAGTAAVATLVLVMIGGLVTSNEAGLAVVDWPNSYGYNMFLFPLARMTGGIYYEHAHRLFGSLVGLATVVLAVRILLTESRVTLKLAVLFAVVLVVGQGVLGGLRVTGHFTWSDSPDVTRPSLALAMVHGIAGQIFFAWMVGIAIAVSRTWRAGPTEPLPSGGTDRAVASTLVVLLLLQLFLGVRLRHVGAGIWEHISFACIVAGVATAMAVRMLGRYDRVPMLRHTAGALVSLAWTQIVLGGIAFMAVNLRTEGSPPEAFEVITATTHQTVGALLLANAVAAWLWIRRLVPRARGLEASPAVS